MQVHRHMSTCNHNHSAPDQILRELHESQAGSGLQRHKCTECAYEAGYQRGKSNASAGGAAVCATTGNSAPQEVMEGLPLSQAGPGRHKCAICAYQEGFETGRSLFKSKSE